MFRCSVYIVVCFLSIGFLSAMQQAKESDCRLRTAGYLAILVADAECVLPRIAPDQDCSDAVTNLAELRATLDLWNDRSASGMKGLSTTSYAWILPIIETYASIPTFNPDCETWKRMAALDILGQSIQHLPQGSKEKCSTIIALVEQAKQTVQQELAAILK